MERKLINTPVEKHDENYYSQILEQYKMYVDSAEKISDRRQIANNYFITINTVFISIIGLSFQVRALELYGWARVLLAFFGITICVIFWYLIRSYRQLNSGKFKVIHEIEALLPLNLYSYEWELLGRGKDKKKYYPFSHVELIIPWVFSLIYLFLGVFLTLSPYA